LNEQELEDKIWQASHDWIYKSNLWRKIGGNKNNLFKKIDALIQSGQLERRQEDNKVFVKSILYSDGIEGKHNFETVLQWQKTKLEESRKELKNLKKPLFKKMAIIQTSSPILPGVLAEDPKLVTSKNTYDLKKVKPKNKTSVIYKPTRKEVSDILDRISTLQDDLLLHVSRTELLRSLDVISIYESNRRLNKSERVLLQHVKKLFDENPSSQAGIRYYLSKKTHKIEQFRIT